MKKKLFTLMTLLLCLCSGAWAQHPTYSLIDGGAINTTHFLTTGTLIDGSNNSTYSKCVTLSGNVSSTTSLSTSANFIAYDVKTTKTVFTVYVYNSNSSSKNLYIHDVKEVLNSSNKATSSMTTVSIKSKTKDDTPVSYTSNNTGRATIYFSSAAGSNAEFYQIIASEEGDPIDDATAGYVGYSLNLKYGRIATKTGETPSYDGIEFCTSSDYKPTNNAELKIKTFGTDYIKFTAAEHCALFLTRTSGNYPYTLGSAKNVAGAIEYGASAAGTDKIVIEPGTYYINPKKDVTSERKITNIEFVPVYAINFAAGTGASGTMTTLYNYEDGKVTVPACSFNAPDGQVFDYWNVAGIDGTTEADPDDELTMPGNAITLTAIWRTEAVKHHVYYNLNGATAGTVPTQADVEEGQQFTVAAVPSDLEAPVGKEFSIWSDGTNNYAPGDPYTMGTSDVTLTAQYVNLKCSTPTITKGDFTFEEKGYKVTITNTQDGGTLKVSTDGETYTTQTSPYVTYTTATTHYYAKSEKASYDDSDVADLNVANTYDTSKPYVAWLTTADDNDGIYTALSSVYNLIKCKYAASATVWNNGENDLKNADLIVLSESVGGGNAITTDMKNFVGQVPMINLKLFAYNSGRWNYGTAADNSSRVFTPSSNLYKVLNGVTFESNGTIELYGSNADKNINSVNFGSGSGCAEPTNNVKMGAIGGDNTKVAMHAIIDNNNLDKQFFGIGLCFGNKANFTDNAITIVKNAAAMLIAGEALNTEFSTISATVGANGYTTFASSYPLDLTDDNRPEGLKAYKATRTGSNLTFEKLNQTVPAGTGLLLLGETKGGSYNIPVAASGTAVASNALVGVTSPVAKQSVADDTYYFVMKKASAENEELKFAPITTAKAVTIPAGKAYIEVPNSELTSARELSYSFDEGNATGINGVEEIAPVTKTRKVVKNGRLVIETANGEFTIDGARVK